MSTKEPSPEVPRISVIVATFQAVASLPNCIESLCRQDFTSWELLIADGGSTDGTLNVIRQYETAIAWWTSEPDNGIYDAWNKAIPNARGEYVCFLGADDVFNDPAALDRLVAAIGPGSYDLVSSCGSMVNRRNGTTTVFGSPWDHRRLGRRMVVCHPGLLHRRSLFDDYGLFDSHYRIAGDLDFLLRLPPRIRTLHVDAVTVRIGGGGVSRENVLQRLQEQRKVLARCKRYGPLKAYLAWLDKLWRLPIARLLGIPH
jgi:glycosyltransferase involved in cell wall biosynthesis